MLFSTLIKPEILLCFPKTLWVLSRAECWYLVMNRQSIKQSSRKNHNFLVHSLKNWKNLTQNEFFSVYQFSLGSQNNVLLLIYHFSDDKNGHCLIFPKNFQAIFSWFCILSMYFDSKYDGYVSDSGKPLLIVVNRVDLEKTLIYSQFAQISPLCRFSNYV